MGSEWRDAKLLQVERRAPLAGPSGKVLHLYIAIVPGRAASRPRSPGASGQKRRVARTIAVAWMLLAAWASIPGRRLRVRS